MNGRDVTIAGYIAIACAGAVLTLLAHRRVGRVARFSMVVSRVARTRTGRVGVMAGWAWLGLHFFAR